MRLAQALNIGDLRELARRRLPRVVFDYLDGGAEDEVTLRANRSAFDRIVFRPRLLPGAAQRDLSVTVLGERLAVPFLIGPTGLNGLLWPQADLALARAARAAGTTMVASTAANSSLEEMAAQGPAARWFQLYPWGKREVWARLIERARAARYTALVVALDSLVPGKRERDLRRGFSHELRYSAPVVARRPAPSALAGVDLAWARHAALRKSG